MFCAAQIWGFQNYDEFEKLLRFFVKKMLFLHKTTPNYVIHLETSMHSMFITTLQLHFSYIEKALNMGPQRLPNILANFVLEKKYIGRKNGMSYAVLWSSMQTICTPHMMCVQA